MKVLIIGAGIGGLCTALALRRAGIEAQVFERAEGAQEAGTGLTLWTNALRALEQLGLTEALREFAMPYTRAAFQTPHGAVLTETSTLSLTQAPCVSPVAIHRADLHHLLLNALGRDAVQFGTRCVTYQQNQRGVHLQLENGESAYGEALIGADGIHSMLRTSLFAGSEPRFAGYTAWRGIARFRHPHAAIETWGRGIRFGSVVLSQDHTYWFATRNESPGHDADAVTRKQGLLTLFHQWHQQIPEIIEATEAQSILHKDIYELKPLPHWSVGRITLLGDAAHAMTPNLGQGACQAIEDAVVLAECIAQYPQPEDAFQAYERRRLARANRILRQSRLLGQIGQWENSFLCGLRDLALRATPPILLRKQLEPIVGYKIPSAIPVGSVRSGRQL
ncbi:FAD-dependent monooxygenase [Ktedonospora formicarum]|uniref:Monooxygenase n=1 Tax=Ktedonospora formicarum TaxID=2778364 RepID=A0A8J3I4Y0_9CHLR|nr:FAD-dependent monooxygenase [Ktedonospora formicarum]GHO46237.1 monooxygenase [Ktedonospora formicarum]